MRAPRASRRSRLPARDLAGAPAALQVRARRARRTRCRRSGEYGILRGLVLAGWRLLRCNPFSHGGFDPVAAQRLFRRHAPRPPLTHAPLSPTSFQPLIDVFESVLQFFHDTVGLQLGPVDHRADGRRPRRCWCR